MARGRRPSHAHRHQPQQAPCDRHGAALQAALHASNADLAKRSLSAFTAEAATAQAAITAARNAADDERLKVGHLTCLLRALGDEIGQPHVKRSSMEWQALGLRVEYLAGVLDGHISEMAKALEASEKAEMGLSRTIRAAG